MTKPKTKQTQFDSNARVHRKQSHGFGLWNNERVTWTFRCDAGLKKAGKRVLRQVFGSDCRGLEAYIAGLVATYEQQGVSGVHPGNTVEIGKLVIERNLRSRRKLVVEEETEVSETVKPVPQRRAKHEVVGYSKYSLEELKRKLDGARANHDVVATQFLAFEIKKRLGNVVQRG